MEKRLLGLILLSLVAAAVAVLLVSFNNGSPALPWLTGSGKQGLIQGEAEGNDSKLPGLPAAAPEEGAEGAGEEKAASEGGGGGSGVSGAGPVPEEEICPEFKNMSIYQFSFGYLASSGGSQSVGGWEIADDVRCSLLEYLDGEAFHCEIIVSKGSVNKTVTAIYSADNATYIETLC